MGLELQFYMFAVMVLTGVGVAAWYDVYRAARIAFRWHRWRGELADLLFWLVAAVLLFTGLVMGTWAWFRIPVLLGIVVGIWLYHALAAPLLSPIWRGLFHAVRRVWTFIGSRLGALFQRGGRTAATWARRGRGIPERLAGWYRRWPRPRWPFRRPS